MRKKISNIDKIVDNQKITRDESRMIGFLQAIAILSVITAHVVSRVSASGFRTAITSVLSAFGCVGVAVSLCWAVFCITGNRAIHSLFGERSSTV
jgi:hypothetical protein